MSKIDADFYYSQALKYKNYWDEAHKENDELASENQTLEDKVTALCFSRDWLKSQLDDCLASKETVQKLLNKIMEKYDAAIEKQGELHDEVEKLQAQNPCVEVGLSERHKDLQDSYNLLEGIRADENSTLNSRIATLAKEVAYIKGKYDACYQYLVTQSQSKSEAASEEWYSIEMGEYPWEKT